ncbi:hypothetical protein QQX98_006246 [Neonectria punicea]|uniref:Peptidase M20 domain-containing protein 2 n=1 Tax=Neonectria punicea TaxID=979145 RepID=A0ABR1H1L3_9HYPO
MEPFGATASAVSIVAVVSQGIGLLHSTIERIHDAPEAIRSIRVDLKALDPVLAQLDTALKGDSPDVLRAESVIPVLQNCNQACNEFNNALDRWTRHSTEDQMSRGDRWRIGLLHQRKIDSLTTELSTCKDSLNTALTAANYFHSTRHANTTRELVGPMLQQVEGSLKESVMGVLDQQSAMNGLVQKLLTEDGRAHEGADHLEELHQQKARNEALNQKFDDLFKQAVQERNKQTIRDIKATDNSFNLAGRINALGPDRTTEQEISGVTADKYSFTAAGVVNGVDFAGVVAATANRSRRESGVAAGSSRTQLPIVQVLTAINACSQQLRAVNQKLHDNPELAYKEVTAHDTITAFLEEQGYTVTRHAYGIDTSFEAEYGAGGRLVIFCAEYDALPDIGHACGHNLIATSSLAGFVALAETVKTLGVKGRVRILGTPAEEGGAGKVKLLEAGAFKGDVTAAIMMHPTANHHFPPGFTALAGVKFVASLKLRVEFHGRPAHAGGEPWKGLNALDAAVAAYTSISMLRQQLRPDERIHGVIEDGGTVPNVIPEYSRVNYYIRSPTLKRGEELLARVKSCFEAAATATGCTLNYIHTPTYMDLRINNTLSREFTQAMTLMGGKVIPRSEEPFTFSTDMGNVSYAVPTFHGAFGIPAPKDAMPHQPRFAEASGTDAAHEVAISCAKGMALLGWRVLTDDEVAQSAVTDFNEKESSD